MISKETQQEIYKFIVQTIRLEQAAQQEEYDAYIEQRTAEDWEGYDTVEAEGTDGWQQGVIAGLDLAATTIEKLMEVNDD